MNRAGFTIVEVLVATLVVTLGLLTLITAFTLSLKLGGQAKEQTVATDLAESTLEQLRSQGFGGLTLGTTVTATSALPSGQITSNITNFDSSNKIKQIEVRITWLNHPDNRAVSLTALVSERSSSGST